MAIPYTTPEKALRIAEKFTGTYVVANPVGPAEETLEKY